MFSLMNKINLCWYYDELLILHHINTLIEKKKNVHENYYSYRFHYLRSFLRTFLLFSVFCSKFQKKFYSNYNKWFLTFYSFLFLFFSRYFAIKLKKELPNYLWKDVKLVIFLSFFWNSSKYSLLALFFSFFSFVTHSIGFQFQI